MLELNISAEQIQYVKKYIPVLYMYSKFVKSVIGAITNYGWRYIMIII